MSTQLELQFWSTTHDEEKEEIKYLTHTYGVSSQVASDIHFVANEAILEARFQGYLENCYDKRGDIIPEMVFAECHGKHLANLVNRPLTECEIEALEDALLFRFDG